MRQYVVLLAFQLLMSVAIPTQETQALDQSFSFGETNITHIRDIELFPDGTIAYGGMGRYATIGTAAADGTVIYPNSGGMQLSVAASVAVDARDRAIYGGGIAAYEGGRSIARVANWDDFSWMLSGGPGGTVSKVLVAPNRDVLVAGRVLVPGDTNNFYGIVRMDSSGRIDSTFDHVASAGIEVTTGALTGEGRIVAGYRLTNQLGALEYGVGRWEANGSRDQSYNVFLDPEREARVTAIEKAPGTNGMVMVVEGFPDGETVRRSTLMPLDESGAGLSGGHPLESVMIEGL